MNMIKLLGLVCLICFSFFYTEKVINVVNEQDEIMIKINELKEKYKVPKIDAIITNNTIIPGINGLEIDVEKSYEEMKEIGIFKEMLLSYKQIKLENSLSNNTNKYVIKGNNVTNNISIILVIDDKNKLDLIKNISYVNLNLFVDYKLLSSNLNKFNKDNFNIYNYANKGKYTNDIITYTNNLIDKKFKNKPLYCLTNNINDEVLKVCSNNKMNTIKKEILKDNVYNKIKNNITNGSIINIEVNTKNIYELKTIINFIKSKGYKIVSLEQLLTEENVYN